jgi:hypothetical protein
MIKIFTDDYIKDFVDHHADDDFNINISRLFDIDDVDLKIKVEDLDKQSIIYSKNNIHISLTKDGESYIGELKINF